MLLKTPLFLQRFWKAYRNQGEKLLFCVFSGIRSLLRMPEYITPKEKIYARLFYL